MIATGVVFIVLVAVTLVIVVVVVMAFMIVVVVVFLVDGLHWLIVAAGGSENAEGKSAASSRSAFVRMSGISLIRFVRETAGWDRSRGGSAHVNRRSSSAGFGGDEDKTRHGHLVERPAGDTDDLGDRTGQRTQRCSDQPNRASDTSVDGGDKAPHDKTKRNAHQQGKATGERISGVGGGGDVAQLRCDRHRGERDRKQTRKQQPGVPGSVGGGGRHASNDTNSIEPSRGRVHPNSSPSWIDTGGAGGRLGSSLWSTTSA